MAMIAFYAGLIVGILLGCLLMSLFAIYLSWADTNLPAPETATEKVLYRPPKFAKKRRMGAKGVRRKAS
jgi:hypothetical protein